jgi:heterodisulfide reductase subunit B2
MQNEKIFNLERCPSGIMTKRYCYFPGCSQETAAGYAQSLDAVCQILGLELPELPGWQCCGASTFFSLDVDQAVTRVARTLALAEGQGFEQIITGCNGCYSTLCKGRKMLFTRPDVLAGAQDILQKEGLALESPVVVRHLLEVLVQDVPVDAWRDRCRDEDSQKRWAKKLKVAPYYGCLFSRLPGSSDDPQHPTMLDTFLTHLGFEIVDHGAKTACCGASHVLSHGQATRELARRIIQTMHHQGATTAATICPLCQFNLDSGQRGLNLEPLPVLFFTQLAGLALGLPTDTLGLDKLLVRMKGT